MNFLKKLVSFRSVAGQNSGAAEFLQASLENLGFKCQIMKFSDIDSSGKKEEISNIWAEIEGEKNLPHFCFAGHFDVVPPGDEKSWKFPPFELAQENGKIFGLGVVDMKGAIACFFSALEKFLEEKQKFGKITLLLTGDEEARGVNGTKKMLETIASDADEKLFDFCLIGEPSSIARAGDNLKLARRGSVNFSLKIKGKKGHVAYPDLALNPISTMIAILHDLKKIKFDSGSKLLEKSNLEITNLKVGNEVTNVIPAECEANFNVRFNDLHSSDSIFKQVKEICENHGECAHFLEIISKFEPFVSEFSPFTQEIIQIATEVIGKKPSLINNGGTSDGRFLWRHAALAELGLCNSTAHQINESCEISEIEDLTSIYHQILRRFFN